MIKNPQTVEELIEKINEDNSLIMLCESGSRLYGFERPDSDIDLRGVYLQPTSSLLGLGNTSDCINGFSLTKELDWDLFEAGKFLNLLFLQIHYRFCKVSFCFF